MIKFVSNNKMEQFVKYEINKIPFIITILVLNLRDRNFVTTRRKFCYIAIK